MEIAITREALNLRLQALGKTGKVIKIYSDGDLRVALDGHTWTFNALSVVLVPAGTNVIAHNVNRNKDRSGTINFYYIIIVTII